MVMAVVVLACSKLTDPFHNDSELLSFNIDMKGVHLIKALHFILYISKHQPNLGLFS